MRRGEGLLSASEGLRGQSEEDSFRTVCEQRQVAFYGLEAGHLPAFKEVIAGSEEQEAWYHYCGGGK